MNKNVTHRISVLSWVLIGLFLLLGFFLVFHLFTFTKSSDELYAKRVLESVATREDLLNETKEKLISLFSEFYEDATPTTIESFFSDEVGVNYIKPNHY